MPSRRSHGNVRAYRTVGAQFIKMEIRNVIGPEWEQPGRRIYSSHSGECALGSAIPGKEHLKNIDHVSQMFLLKHFENIRKTF